VNNQELHTRIYKQDFTNKNLTNMKTKMKLI